MLIVPLVLPRKQGAVGPSWGEALGSELLWGTGFLLSQLLPPAPPSVLWGASPFLWHRPPGARRGALGGLSAAMSTQEGGKAVGSTVWRL